MKGILQLTVSLALLLQTVPAGAALVWAELRVNGLSCPFCAFGIEKKLLDVDGVESVEVFLDEGRLTLTFDRENEATVSDIEKAVEKGGFELAGLKLTVRGTLEGGSKGDARLVASPRMGFRLVERSGQETQSISRGTLERLRASAEDGGVVVVSGAVEARGKSPPTLVLESAEAEAR